MKLQLVLLVCPLFVAAVGCGPSHDKLVPVTGTVTLDGKPLAEGTIIFDSPTARGASGKIANGKIVEVTTYEAGDGITIGNHNIAIFSTEAVSEPTTAANPGDASGAGMAGYMGIGGKSLVAKRYNDPTTSGLTALISDGEKDLKLELSP